MTYEEASGKSTLDRSRIEALSKAIKAIEKQTPKKPILKRERTSLFGEDDVPYCPNCKCRLSEVSYCEECGQVIDWSDIND